MSRHIEYKGKYVTAADFLHFEWDKMIARIDKLEKENKRLKDEPRR